MKPADLAELFALAALWGGSFIFMRLGAGEFGALPLAWLRVAGAALVLLPLLVVRSELGDLRTHWRPILIVGITNSALPFALFAYAALTISAGLSAIFNAATPLFGAVIAWLWLKDRLGAPRIVGLVIGFAGVFWLGFGKVDEFGDAGPARHQNQPRVIGVVRQQDARQWHIADRNCVGSQLRVEGKA